MQQANINCKFCDGKFNTNNKLPILICQQNHTLCLQCLQILTAPFLCPFCKTTITKQKVRLDQHLFKSMGGIIEGPLEFRYMFYKDQLRFMLSNNHKILANAQSEFLSQKNEESYQISQKMLKILTVTFFIFTIVNLIMHLFLVFTEQQQCIDWDQNPNTYTIRSYLKLNTFLNIACFSVAGALHLAEHSNIKQFVQKNGMKLIGTYIILRLASEIVMWSHFMFIMQPQCSSFIYLLLHVQTFGYYIFAFLFIISFVYFYIRKQKLPEQQQ